MKRLVTLAVVSAALIAPVLGASAAAADTLPFSDPAVAGRITLCDKNLKPLTSGDIRKEPFVWRAVSDVPTTGAYFTSSGMATLYAFQPREKVPPAEWTGKQLTATSVYTNAKVPMVQSVPNDIALRDFVSVAPLWDGLVQLRIFLSNDGVPVQSKPYAAAVIKVTGTTWKLVSGGGGSCTDGKAVSVATLLLTPSQTGASPSPKPTGAAKPGSESTAAPATPAAEPGQSPASTDGAGSGESGAPATSETSGGTAVAAGDEAEVPGNSGGTGLMPVIVLGLVAVIAAAGGAFLLGRRSTRN